MRKKKEIDYPNGLERMIMHGWWEEVELAQKRAQCKHSYVLWGVDGKTGVCFNCGKTIKKK
ncbi:MAG: hypothetical protein QXR93_06865 [Archaeoglobaceae archaeon]